MNDIKPTLVQALTLSTGIEIQLLESDGEITPEIQALIDIRDEILLDRVDAYAYAMKQIQAKADGLQDVIEEYSKLQKSLQNVHEKMKDRIRLAIDTLSLDSLEGSQYKFTRQRNPPKVDVFEESLVPKEFIRTVESVSVSQIRDALKSGVDVPGARLTESFHIRLKLKVPDKTPKLKEAPKP